MAINKALLLDGQKMSTEGHKIAGDRKLRVTRAKSTKRSDMSDKSKNRNKKPERRGPQPKVQPIYVPKPDPKDQALVGRASKLLGRAGASILKKQGAVFEGLRATKDTDSGIRKGGSGGGKRKGKPRARSTAWRKGQVKK